MNFYIHRSTENLLHRLFVCIAGVADQLQTNFASDLRQILRSVFLMNMSSAQEEIDIPEKTKESELFEFRASENDVIQESAGSNQSIYSAEEVNPELDNVFSAGGGNQATGQRHSAGASMQRNNTIDLVGQSSDGSPSGATMAQSAVPSAPSPAPPPSSSPSLTSTSASAPPAASASHNAQWSQTMQPGSARGGANSAREGAEPGQRQHQCRLLAVRRCVAGHA